VRQIFRQPQYDPLPVARQIAALVAVNAGLFDPIDPDLVTRAEKTIQRAVIGQLPELCERIEHNARLTAADSEAIAEVARKALAER
jgi:F-type H+-transporting ATPase subunit alpha